MSIVCILFSICTNPWQWMTTFASMAFSVAQRILAPWITLASLTLIAIEITAVTIHALALCIVGASVTVLYGAVCCTVHGYRLARLLLWNFPSALGLFVARQLHPSAASLTSRRALV